MSMSSNSISNAVSVNRTTPTAPAGRLAQLARLQTATATATVSMPTPINPPVARISPSQVHGPLPIPVTITITFIPDWNWMNKFSPENKPEKLEGGDYLKYGEPLNMVVILCPRNTNTPTKDATWRISLKVLVLPQSTTFNAGMGFGEISIEYKERVMLNYVNPPIDKVNPPLNVFNPTFMDAINEKEWSLNPEFITSNITIRNYSENGNPNALGFVPKQAPNENNSNRTLEGYFRLIQGHRYYMNFTFNVGSCVAQKANIEGWRFRYYLEPIAKNSIPHPFFNFITNWAQGIELAPNEDDKYNDHLIPLSKERLQRVALWISTVANELQNFMLNNQNYDPQVLSIVTSYLYYDMLLAKMKKDVKVAQDYFEQLSNVSHKGQEPVLSESSVEQNNSKQRTLLQLFDFSIGNANSKLSETATATAAAGTASTHDAGMTGTATAAAGTATVLSGTATATAASTTKATIAKK